MPALGSSTPIPAVYPGDVYDVITTTDTAAGNVTSSLPIAIARAEPGPRTITIVNTTNQAATINIADTSTGPYESTGYVVAAGTSMVFNVSGPFVNLSFAAAPTTGYASIVG